MQVDGLEFSFDSRVVPSRYDEWQHYKHCWQKQPSNPKAVDIVAVEGGANPGVAWLIEAKDYRVVTKPPSQSNLGSLADTVAAKALDTMAGLSDAATRAVDNAEKSHAAKAVAAPTKRIVLHLEPHTGPHTALFPQGFAALVLQRLRQLVRAIDPNPLVLNIAVTNGANVPWSVS